RTSRHVRKVPTSEVGSKWHGNRVLSLGKPCFPKSLVILLPARCITGSSRYDFERYLRRNSQGEFNLLCCPRSVAHFCKRCRHVKVVIKRIWIYVKTSFRRGNRP